MSTLNNAMITIQLRMAMMTHDFGMKTTWGNYPTASTGPGLVRMPFFDANDPVQCKAAMGFGLHEGSHHRYQSDFSLMSVAAQMGKFYTHMLNVFEDARVDRNALREYPGIKSEYAAIEELFIQRNVSALESASFFPKISSSHLKSITSSLDFHYDHSRTC